MQHISVLKDEVEEYLALEEGQVIVDGTLGLGGHSLLILNKIGTNGHLIVFEQDSRNLQEAQKRLKQYEGQITYFHDNFCTLKSRITGSDYDSVDAVFLDLGLSSPHVDEAERGFSFMQEGPLDMRFDQRKSLTAAEIVNEWEEEDLARIFRDYGEERMAKKVARLICGRRKEQEFRTTTDLADFLENVLPKKRSKRASTAHPATKVFQALRIAVNEELEVLQDVLEQAMEVVKVGGRIVILTYHSLEDRIVKHFFKELERPKAVGEEAIYSNYGEPIVQNLTKKPVIPSEEELSLNPRSRSAKLRAYKKLKNN